MDMAYVTEDLIYYHMDTLQSMGLAQTYFTNLIFGCPMLGLYHLFIPLHSHANRASGLLVC